VDAEHATEVASWRGPSRSNVAVQFAWYLLVGGCSFLADFAVFAMLLRLGAGVVLSLVVGFLVGTVCNYLLSRFLAFSGGRRRRTVEFTMLVAVSIAGLALTVALVTLLMRLGASAILAKILATPVALIWNYAGRRLFVFAPDMPIGTWHLSSRALVATRALRGRKAQPPPEFSGDDG
jgi:putative flippase GtrA